MRNGLRIGRFLNSAAIRSDQQVVIHDMLEGIPVARLMRSNVTAVPPTITVGELVYRYVMGTDEHAFPVIDGDQLRGLVTLEGIRKVARENWDTTTARDIMMPPTNSPLCGHKMTRPRCWIS